MFSLLRQRTTRCPIRVASLVLTCVLGFLFCAQSSASAAASDTNNASPLIVVPQSMSRAPGEPVVALSPEQWGDLQMARRDYAAAVHAYQQGPLTSALLWNKIGIAYHHMFAFNKAEKAYRTALKLDPRYPEALNNLAAVYFAKRKYKKSERTYRLALDYQPEAAVIYSNLGTSYIADAKYKQGQQAYQTAIKLNPNVFSPDDPSLLYETSSREQLRAIDYYLACAYARAGRKAEALNFLRQAFGEGLSDGKHLLADKDFDPIRSSPEFKQLLLEQHFD